MEYKDFIEYANNLDVLIVDNDLRFATQTEELLKMFFRDVVCIVNGQDALRTYKNFYLDSDRYFDIVITELSLAEINGEELVQELKLLNRDQNIVVVSKEIESQKLITLIKYGIDYVLTKPIDSNELQECLYKVSKGIYQRSHNITKIEDHNKDQTNLAFLHDDDEMIEY